MTDHPILFKFDMVQAILDGRKTQTRRVIPGEIHIDSTHTSFHWHKPRGGYMERHDERGNDRVFRNILADHCPYGVPGDLLWVRETHRYQVYPYQVPAVQYKAGGDPFLSPKHAAYMKKRISLAWRPSIFMPKWACRLWLKVKSVRVEQVQEISEDDAKAEGMKGAIIPSTLEYSRKYNFQCIWDSINAKRGYGWDMNGFVWVIEFERHNK